jgi:uncharacterized Zn finger protein
MSDPYTVRCPKCGEEKNFHYNYDYSRKDIPVIDILCNECGEFFKQNEKPKEWDDSFLKSTMTAKTTPAK